MHSFLKRHRKGDHPSKDKTRTEEDGGGGGGGGGGGEEEDHYHEAVSKSMDSLLLLASSVSLPPRATPSSSQPFTHPTQRRRTEPRPQVGRENGATGVERRHSYDLATGKLTADDLQDDLEGGAGCLGVCGPGVCGGTHHCAHLSAHRAGQAGRADSADRDAVSRGDSSDRDTVSRHPWLTALTGERERTVSLASERERTASMTSEREWSDSDDERSATTSVPASDSRLFLLSDDNDHGYLGFYRSSRPPPTPSASTQSPVRASSSSTGKGRQVDMGRRMGEGGGREEGGGGKGEGGLQASLDLSSHLCVAITVSFSLAA